MHKLININIKKIIIVNLVFFLFSSFVNLYSEECQNFDTKLKEAKEYFPIFNEIVLNYSLRDAFIKNYNKFSKEEEELIADEVVLLALLDRNEWYIFAAQDDCLVFWVKLSISLCFTCPSTLGPFPSVCFGGGVNLLEGRVSLEPGKVLGTMRCERGVCSGAGNSLPGGPEAPGI